MARDFSLAKCLFVFPRGSPKLGNPHKIRNFKWTCRKLIRISQLCNTKCNTKKKKSRKYDVFTMDLAGIEPASESLSLAASPITVAVLTFPPQHAHRQAYCFSSFMIHLPGQSLPGKVSHIVDTRFLMCECIRADEQRLGC